MSVDPVLVVLYLEVRAEETHVRGPFAVDIAAADAVVPDLQLADHLDQQFVQVLAALHELEQRLVARAHRAPVEAMHVRVVEVLLLHAPGLVEDLVPFLARIDAASASR